MIQQIKENKLKHAKECGDLGITGRMMRKVKWVVGSNEEMNERCGFV
jgi:hypothetical protein